MSIPQRWVLATGNRGKVAELGALLRQSALDLTLVSQAELGVAGAEETAATFVENALQKARHASRVAGLPAIADDSGLVVSALGGAPGIHSARFAGPDANDEANLARLLSLLSGSRDTERAASFHCVLVALLHADDPAPLIATGEWPGQIGRAARGQGGFGYDPVFVVPALGRTAAELSPDEKNRLSHRGQALRQLVELLKKR